LPGTDREIMALGHLLLGVCCAVYLVEAQNYGDFDFGGGGSVYPGGGNPYPDLGCGGQYPDLGGSGYPDFSGDEGYPDLGGDDQAGGGEGCGCPEPNDRRRRSSLTKKKQIEVSGMNVTKVGDMYFTDRDIRRHEGGDEKFRAVNLELPIWPNGRMKYYMKALPPQRQQQVRQALQQLTQATGGCVTFEEIHQQLPPGTNYVVLDDKGSCASFVGRVGQSSQEISLTELCYSPPALIMHEFMHALGFYHEQERPDRDQHIRMQWKNVQSDACDQFEKCKTCKVFGEYDLSSVMQYAGNYGACRWGVETMQSHKHGKIHPPQTLSASDINKIRQLYQCRGNGPSPRTH